jgi:putative iron-regulated protein
VSKPTDDALEDMITGIGEMSRGELAAQRLSVAYNERSEEDEHSCFSDNTTADIVANAQGIANVVTGDYPGVAAGPGLADLVESRDKDAAVMLAKDVAASVRAARAIPAPFDQSVRDGVPDNSPGRVAMLKTIESLEAQAETIVAGASALGISIEVT